MSFVIFLPILVSAAAAQSTIHALTNAFISNTTVTLKESNPTAMTYVFNCPSLPSACISALQATSTVPSDEVIQSILEAEPSANPCSGVPNDFIANPDWNLCGNYTLVQGPSTYEFHETANTVYTMDVNCNWKGAMTTADLTCTVFTDGIGFTGYSGSSAGSETSTLKRDEVAEETLIVPFTVVTPSGGSAARTIPAPTGANTATGNASPNPSNSAGLAPAGPLPTGLIGFVGGAAAVLAAAVAL